MEQTLITQDTSGQLTRLTQQTHSYSVSGNYQEQAPYLMVLNTNTTTFLEDISTAHTMVILEPMVTYIGHIITQATG